MTNEGVALNWVILLMVQKSGDHQLIWSFYPVIYRILAHPRWFSRWISEPSTYGGCHGSHVGPPAQKVPGGVASNQTPRLLRATKEVDRFFFTSSNG